MSKLEKLEKIFLYQRFLIKSALSRIEICLSYFQIKNLLKLFYKLPKLSY